MITNFEQAKDFFLQGLGHYQAGRFIEAEADFAASLALVPGRASTLTNLGATRLKLGKLQQACDLLDEALAQEPGNAQALGHRATALAELGRHEEALACVDSALAADPAAAAAWTLRGTLLRELARPDEAALAFEQAIAHGADEELNRYFLAPLRGGRPPGAAPRAYVEALFDGYAGGFEEHLVSVLKYTAPEILADRLRGAGRQFASALDLGCGTGLCGLQLRPLAKRLVGVDLSGNMVAQARARCVYDEVVQADLVHHLARPGPPHDLMVAADVFIYVGALEPVFERVAAALARGGVFCFSVEACEDEQELVLRPSLRYAHSLGYIQKLAEQYGFEISATAGRAIREDQGKPIPGIFAWLVRR